MKPAFFSILACPAASIILSARECDAWSVFLAYFTYLFVLSVSITLYRISPFHPLAKYPGPLIFKITKLAGLWATYTGNQHRIYKRMHDEYGSVVRLGKEFPVYYQGVIHNFKVQTTSLLSMSLLFPLSLGQADYLKAAVNAIVLVQGQLLILVLFSLRISKGSQRTKQSHCPRR